MTKEESVWLRNALAKAGCDSRMCPPEGYYRQTNASTTADETKISWRVHAELGRSHHQRPSAITTRHP